MLTYKYDHSSGQTHVTDEVVMMDEDGSNQSVAGTFSANSIYCKFMTPSKVYFLQSDASSGDYKSVGAQSFDGSDRQVLHTASDGGKIQRFYVVDGKLYVEEQNDSTETVQVIRMNEDGSEASTVYSQSSDENDGAGLFAVSHGCLYMFNYNTKNLVLTIERVPLDGSPAAAAPGPSNYSGYTTLNDAGDHLLVISESDVGGALSAYTLDFDGNKLQDYVVSGS